MNPTGPWKRGAWAQAQGSCWLEPEDARSLRSPTRCSFHSSAPAGGERPSVMGD